MFNNIYKKVKIDDDKNLYFVADLHGQFCQFHDILSTYLIKKDDHIVSVGDLVDRGPNSFPLLNLFFEKPNFHFVNGNHELAMVYANYSKEDMIFWMGCGGRETYNELGKDGLNFFAEKLQAEIPFILEIEHRGKRFGIVHANIPFLIGKQEKNKKNVREITQWDEFVELALNNQDYLNDALWGQNKISNILFNKDLHHTLNKIEGIDWVLHGHYGVKEPIIIQNRVWFDTWFLGENNPITLLNYNNYDDKNNVHPWNFLIGENYEL